MPSENDIRDKLAEALTLLENGLTLIETNHLLPNSAGAKGFVDILARDRLGHYVVIELKRSDQTAREAMHEILKYMRLFREHHGIEAHKLRCFIVSTTWRELLVPFSEFRRRCEAQAEGFEIAVDCEGRVTSVSRVIDHALEHNPLFYHHSIICFRTASDRKKAEQLICDCLTQQGATGHLLIHLDFKGDNASVIHPYASYIVPTKIAPHVVKSLHKEALRDLGEAEIEQQRYTEEVLLSRFIGGILPRIKDVDCSIEIGYAEKFTGLVEGNWVVTLLKRTGPFANRKVISDATLVDLVKGIGGMNVHRFERLTSPSQPLDWAEARAASVRCLGGNQPWAAGYKWFLDRVEATYPDGDMLAHIYNPQMLPETIYHMASERELAYMPSISVMVSTCGVDREALIGGVEWDEKTIPQSPAAAFSRIKDGVCGYYLSLSLNDVAHLDRMLMKRHGLSYGLWRVALTDKGNKAISKLVVSRNGRIKERPESLMQAMLPDFLTAASEYVVALMNEIDQHFGRSFEGQYGG